MYKELITYIVTCLVESKEEVVITERQEEDTLIVTVKVAPSDMGRIKGKEGRIIKSIRELVRAYSAKEKAKVQVEIDE